MRDICTTCARNLERGGGDRCTCARSLEVPANVSCTSWFPSTPFRKGHALLRAANKIASFSFFGLYNNMYVNAEYRSKKLIFIDNMHHFCPCNKCLDNRWEALTAEFRMIEHEKACTKRLQALYFDKAEKQLKAESDV